jgi:hypothetical protein
LTGFAKFAGRLVGFVGVILAIHLFIYQCRDVSYIVLQCLEVGAARHDAKQIWMLGIVHDPAIMKLLIRARKRFFAEFIRDFNVRWHAGGDPILEFSLRQ